MVLLNTEIRAAVKNQSERVIQENKARVINLKETALQFVGHPVYSQFDSVLSACRKIVSNQTGIADININRISIDGIFHQQVTCKEAYEELGEKTGLLIKYTFPSGPAENHMSGDILYVPSEGFKPAISMTMPHEVFLNDRGSKTEIPILNDNLSLNTVIPVNLDTKEAASGTDFKLYTGLSKKTTDGGQIEVIMTEIVDTKLARDVQILIGWLDEAAQKLEAGEKPKDSLTSAIPIEIERLTPLLDSLNKALNKNEESADAVKVKLNAAVHWAKDISERATFAVVDIHGREFSIKPIGPMAVHDPDTTEFEDGPDLIEKGEA